MRRPVRRLRVVMALSLFALLAGLLPAPAQLAALAPPAARAADPAIVTLVGSLQSELGCAGDWDPACAATRLVYDAADDAYRATFAVPAGGFEFKVALDNSWDVNYGAGAQQGGANIPLSLAALDAGHVLLRPGHATGSRAARRPRSRSHPAASSPSSAAPATGSPTASAPGCRTSTATAIYAFETTDLPAGSYEGKVALDESWDVNYGAGGVPGGPNIPFTVPAAGYNVVFSWDSATKIPTIEVVSTGPKPDNNVEWDGLRHDSRDLLYRTPGGAVPAGTEVVLRLRTFHDDVTGVKVRFYSVDRGGQEIVDMAPRPPT